MRPAEPNWDLRRIPVSWPYIRILVRGVPPHGDDAFSRAHPRMSREHRAKIFAPFDALDGFTDRIRRRNGELEDALEREGR